MNSVGSLISRCMRLVKNPESWNSVTIRNILSMPQGGMEALKTQEPLEILAYQYDLVCNGVELSSGAVRNHDPEIMIKAFELVGLGEDDVKAKFPAMYNAFCYGAPPHAGIAPGVLPYDYADLRRRRAFEKLFRSR